jgi:hypothetical protein
MNSKLYITDLVRATLLRPTGGIVGLVENLLTLCGAHGLQLDWQPDRYLLRSPGKDWEELVDVRLRKSVFRAVLARFAVLCNETKPGSVSPFGGQGELRGGADSTVEIGVHFVNTPDEQRLEMIVKKDPAENGQAALGQHSSVDIRPIANAPGSDFSDSTS